MSVEFSFVLLSFCQGRLGSSCGTSLTFSRWQRPTGVIQWPSAPILQLDPVPASSPSLLHHCVLIQLHCFAATSWLPVSLLGQAQRLFFFLSFTQVFLFHDFAQPVLLFHSLFSANSSLQSPCPPSKTSCNPSFPSHISVLLDLLSHEFLSTLTVFLTCPLPPPLNEVVSFPVSLRPGDTQGKLTPVLLSEAPLPAAGSCNYRESLFWVWQSYKQMKQSLIMRSVIQP